MALANVTVIVDAENVRRSVWPNIAARQLVELVERWAEREGHRALVVFEGEDTADDAIARWASAPDGPYWLVTSDRELRARAGDGAEQVIGGGAFARMLQDLAQ